MKKLIFYSVFIILVISLLYYLRNPLKPKIIINNNVINVEIALTPQQISNGLSYRKSLNRDEGMLFVFGNKDIRPFWMFEMRFPLDIVWIDGNKIVAINSNVPVNTGENWTVVNPGIPVNRVLELNGGITDKLNIKVGDEVIYKN
jgi:uncharacterized membrane protein (UPF0127 family)